MEYTKLGKTDLTVSRIGMGCWAIGGHGWGPVEDETSILAIRRAFDLGVTLFDTADVYGLGHSEEILAKALGNRRDEVTIVTKFGIVVDDQGNASRNNSPKHVVEALEASLKRLGLERIPLYLIHWPDARTPIQDTLDALARCQEAGKIRYIGCSNFSVSELKQARRLDVYQGPYSILQREMERELLSYCRANDLGVLSYDVLAKGLLTGKFSRTSQFDSNHVRGRDPNFRGEQFERNLQIVDRLREMARKFGRTPAQVAIRWVLNQPGVSCALTGITSAGQIEENVGGADWQLPAEDQRAIGLLTASPRV